MAEKNQFEMLDIFGNRNRSGYEEIVSYGPHWWTEYREMDANYRFAGWTLDLMALWLEKIINNQFVMRCDEDSLAEFESILRIYPDEHETIQERKRTVASYWSGTGKLSGSTIKSLVNIYTGGTGEVWWVGDELNVRIISDEDVSYSTVRLINILQRRMPAHIPIAIRNVLCSFLLQENFEHRITHRITCCNREGCFDGSMSFDGSFNFDNIPPEGTKLRHRIVSENEEPTFELAEQYRVQTDGLQEDFSETVTVRIPAIWWETGTFSGDQHFDGTASFDQEQPPSLSSLAYRVENEICEEFTMSIYKAAYAAKFDGTAAFDGTYKFNNGRETL